MENQAVWYKKRPGDSVWWLNNPGSYGKFIFSFDKETRFNLFADYPRKLTPRQKEIFDNENPRWKNFFSDRQ